ncbi:type IX secretion system plug protein [Larkinella arboricola]
MKPFFPFFLLFNVLTLVRVSAQKLPTEDRIFENTIKTVLLYPVMGSDPTDPAQTLNPPVIDQATNTQLMLEFDDLTANYRPFRAKFVHCNADWQQSILSDIEFTYEYNDYPIQDYQISQNTKIPYYHYRFPVPKMKLPGNYVLVVYNERNPREIYFSRRFVTYINRVGLAATVQFANDPQQRFTDQQINFEISYRGYPLISPQEDLKIVIRQNYRDDRVITGLRPTNVRAFDNILEYRLFDLKNTFPGGNEYRYFDTRTVFSRGNYIQQIERRDDRNTAFINPDGVRSVGAYVQTDDFNGQYVVDILETHIGATQADYITTVFTLRMDELANAEVFVNSAFNFWRLDDLNRMTYVPDLRAYQAEIPLKQGVYNYNYSVKGIPPPVARSGMNLTANETLIEGNYSETENDYEVFVYHRPPAARADQLVAYRRLGYNKRK